MTRHRSKNGSAKQVQSVDQRMRLGMRCRLSPTADVPSHTSGQLCASVRHWKWKRAIKGVPYSSLYQAPSRNLRPSLPAFWTSGRSTA